jgi:ribonuclease HI
VVTSYPLRVILHNSNATGNIAKWVAELDFIPCHAVKSQVLANFVAGWTPPPCNPGGPNDSESEPRAPVFIEPYWTLFFDGSSHKQGARVGVLLLTLSGEQFKYMLQLDFKATNNMAEYKALIFELNTMLSLGIQQLLVKGDSQLIIKQVKGECSCNDPQLVTYLLHAQKMEKDFEVLYLHHIPRTDKGLHLGSSPIWCL